MLNPLAASAASSPSPSAESAGRSPAPRISVIMRSRNSDWVIGQALASLFSQSLRDFELLVVDSGSRDRTLEIVRQYPCRLIQIEPADYLPGRVLNAAIRESRGELIVFQNSDVVPLGSRCLERLVGAFDDSRVAAAFARQATRPEALPWVRRDYAASFPRRGPAPPWIKLSLPLAAIRRSAWQRRPFYEAAWASEDTQWGAAAERDGETIRYVADAAVMHSHNYTLAEIYGRRFAEGEADAFIERADAPWWQWALRACGATLSDLRWHWAARDWRGVGGDWLRRGVYHWAHYRGRCWGRRRQREGDDDPAFGQRAALRRHHSATSSRTEGAR